MAARPARRAVRCAVVAGSRTGTNCSRTVAYAAARRSVTQMERSDGAQKNNLLLDQLRPLPSQTYTYARPLRDGMPVI